MEGRGRGRFPYNNPPGVGAGPPLTAIDKFLCGEISEYLSNNNNIDDEEIEKKLNICNGGLISSSSSSSSCYGEINIPYHADSGGRRHPWPILLHHNTHVFVDRQEQKWIHFDDQPLLLLGDNNNIDPNGKTADSLPLIKGQWTDEEDRKLRKLVKEYGVKKWAQIAEKMVARAGKQCRERWHNHLRPHIKKDTWSEDEELMLVEAHEQIGNRWAEIAKRIPGRTENSIKNHWNATKRRQNSRRKPQQQKQSTLLQDYIRSLSPKSNTITILSSNNNKTDPLTPDLSQYSTSDDHSPSYLTQTCDDEMNFMHNLFGEYHSNDTNINPRAMTFSSPTRKMDFGFFSSNFQINSYAAGEDQNCYLSQMFEGGKGLAASSTEESYGNIGNVCMEMEMEMEMDSSCVSVRNDVDLIEMISGSQFSRPTTSSNGFIFD